MKSKIYIIGLAVFAAIALSAGTLIVDDSQRFLEKRIILVVREIGHELLHHAGDSTSRILPVKKIDKNTFQLEFQSRFSFSSDTLVKIVHQRMNSAKLPPDYMVNVYNCGGAEIIFGYEMRSKDNDLLPCLGREQTIDCYKIQIEFTGDYNTSQFMNPWWAIGFVMLGGTLFSLFSKRFVQKESISLPTRDTHFVDIGKYVFYPEKALLKNGTEQIELSDKENKLLGIFAVNQNRVIERDRLLKEVWEDEGVFVVGRSLDVFVSKLRKKLQGDEGIRITSVHGKGYKLEVTT